jgi:hypothetical protein
MSLLYWVEKLSGVKSAWRRAGPSCILEGRGMYKSRDGLENEMKLNRNEMSSRVERVEIVISKKSSIISLDNK